ncbi:MAG: ABC transporter permease [Bacteroidota bacterium]
MLKNYFKIAYRSLLKNSVYTFINVAGLSVGIASSLLISLWVYDEVTFNSMHSKRDRLYQVWIHSRYAENNVQSYTSMPLALYEKLKTADVHITNVTTTDWGGSSLLAVGDKSIVKNGHYVTTEFLDMFDFPVVAGDKKTMLLDPNNIVLTESTAKALFGDADPIGQVIRRDAEEDLKVTGIMKDVPGNSSFQFDYLLSHALYEQQGWVKRSMTTWTNFSFPIYLETQSADDRAAVEASIKNLVNDNTKDGVNRDVFIYPMDRWRLHSTFKNGVEQGGLIDYVNAFGAIAGFIVLIACINFMNLATARSERRAREVGIRKAIGSQRKELIFQFLGESLLLSLIAFVFAILLTEAALPFYNTLLNKKLFIDFSSWQFWTASLGLITITGVVAGSYPAFFLSSFRAVKVLKGSIGSGKQGSIPRKVLVTFQFVFSIVAIIAVIGIYKQIAYVKARDIGYKADNLIYVDAFSELIKNYDALKRELIDNDLATAVTRSNSPITDIYSNNFLRWPGMPADQNVSFVTISTGYDYTKTMGIQILEGRDFSEDFKSDTTAIIINKAALDLMGLKDPIGTQVTLWDSKRTIVGVIDNALMGSPFQQASPAFLIFMPDWVGAFTIRLKPTDDVQGQMAKVESIFKKYNPAYPFNYYFADQEFSKKFNTIGLIEKLTNVFAGLALVITGLGLFGLAAFTAEQRNREIGIRKVLGASLTNIVTMISRDFSLLVLIAFIFAAPLGWWLINNYLTKYEYHTTVQWWIVPVVGVVTFVISFAIVATQALRAGMNNPVETLRSE